MSTWDVKIGERFSGAIIDVARLNRHPATARDWDWVAEHLAPRITPEGVILDPDGEPLGPRPESPPVVPPQNTTDAAKLRQAATALRAKWGHPHSLQAYPNAARYHLTLADLLVSMAETLEAGHLRDRATWEMADLLADSVLEATAGARPGR